MVALGTVAPPFELTDVITGKAVGRDDVAADAKGMLVMFVCPHCPYVKHVEAELGRIGRDYQGKIGIVAINANDVSQYPEDGPEHMKEQASRNGWTRGPMRTTSMSMPSNGSRARSAGTATASCTTRRGPTRSRVTGSSSTRSS